MSTSEHRYFYAIIFLLENFLVEKILSSCTKIQRINTSTTESLVATIILPIYLLISEMKITMTRLNVRNQKHKAGIAAISAAIVAVMAMSMSPAAFANLPGNPTMWTDAVNPGQVNTYNYNVAGGANLHVALMVDNANSKPVMTLTAIDPTNTAHPCPVIGGTTLTVAECNIAGPIAGVWTIQVTAGALPAGAQPTEYAVAAHAL
ncbi:MAG: hypothetical protein KGI27_08780 [Thaumarchaeota archaeon]|nr:hypothetical protein [Nitrososphaerota archaeon]